MYGHERSHYETLQVKHSLLDFVFILEKFVLFLEVSSEVAKPI